MINTKFCRNKMLEILNQISTKMDKNNRVLVQKKIIFLNEYVENEYNYDVELPKISHRLISEMVEDLEDLDLLLGNVFVAESFDMPEDVKNEEEQLIDFARSLIDKYDLNQKVLNNVSTRTDIYPMLNKYTRNYGKERILDALKIGLDMFLKQKTDIFSKDFKMTDENWPDILEFIRDKYSVQTIEKYLNKGLISNLIFETKNSKNINTTELIESVLKLKKEGKYE